MHSPQFEIIAQDQGEDIDSDSENDSPGPGAPNEPQKVIDEERHQQDVDNVDKGLLPRCEQVPVTLLPLVQIVGSILTGPEHP